MTENKRYIRFIDNYEDVYLKTPTGQKIEIGWEDDVCVDSIDEVVNKLNELSEENEQLKKELFESEKDYLLENYSDNPTRRDEKIRALTEEFKERFGDLE